MPRLTVLKEQSTPCEVSKLRLLAAMQHTGSNLPRETTFMAASSNSLSATSIAIGFVSAAIAVVTVHQSIIYGLSLAKILPASVQAWSMAPVPPYAVPKIVNDMFWGGLWGALFAVIWQKLPGGAMWLRGLIFGLIIALISNWTLVPFIKSTFFKVPNQLYFAGFDPTRMMATLLIVGGFGLTTGLIFSVLRGKN
jgi:hypothetical protein